MKAPTSFQATLSRLVKRKNGKKFKNKILLTLYFFSLATNALENGNRSVRLSFHPECLNLVQVSKRGKQVLVMHNPGRDRRWTVDGNSVFKQLNDEDYDDMKRFLQNIDHSCPMSQVVG